MKKRIIIISIILISLLVLLKFFIFENFTIYNFKNSKPVILAGESIQEKNEEKDKVITAPIKTKNQIEEQRLKEHETALAEKKEFEEKVKENDIVITEDTTLTEEEKVQMDAIMNMNNILENNAVEILKKYYGDNEIEMQMEEIRNDMSKVTSGNLQKDYIISENGILLIKKVFNLIDRNEVSNEEKDILIKYLKCIDPIGIKNDEELKIRMYEL